MKLNERSVELFLSEEGRKVLQGAAPELPDSTSLWFQVQETDEMGIWVGVERAGTDHALLIRWDYVLAVSSPIEEQTPIGLRP